MNKSGSQFQDKDGHGYLFMITPVNNSDDGVDDDDGVDQSALLMKTIYDKQVE